MSGEGEKLWRGGVGVGVVQRGGGGIHRVGGGDSQGGGGNEACVSVTCSACQLCELFLTCLEVVLQLNLLVHTLF